jgi:hypothetical protein
LQGKHRDRVVDFLIKKGYREELIETRGWIWYLENGMKGDDWRKVL